MGHTRNENVEDPRCISWDYNQTPFSKTRSRMLKNIYFTWTENLLTDYTRGSGFLLANVPGISVHHHHNSNLKKKN